MRVYLDTNVLASAFATRGLTADLLRYILAEHTLLTGEVNLAELKRILRRKLGVPAETVAEIERFLREQTIVPKPGAPATVPVRDPDDRWVLASALAGEADVLVSGDRDLLDVAGEASIPIVDPRGFWDLVRQTPPRR